MKRRSLTSLIPLVAVSSAAAAENSAEVRRRRPPRHLNREQGTSIVRSKARRNLQGEEDGEDDGVPYLSACIGRYPGYNLELGAWVNPNGHVRTIYFGRGTEMLFEFDVYENEDHCKDCRIHIARGMTCDDADQVGGHYWNSDVLEDDPWTRRNGAYYNSNNNGKAIGAFEIDNGYSYEENLGHAVVIYAMDGSTQIGCGVLEAGDRGMYCDPFEDGDGGRDDDEDESSSEGDSALSQDDVSEDSSNSASSPSSLSASAPSPSAPSPSYNSDMSFDHGDSSDSEVDGDVLKHDAESSDDRRGHRHDSDDEESDHESSVTFSSSTVESKHGKSSKSSKSSSSKTKSSRQSQGKGKGSSSKRSSTKEEREQSNYSEMDESASKESKHKSKKSAKLVRRRQR